MPARSIGSSESVRRRRARLTGISTLKSVGHVHSGNSAKNINHARRGSRKGDRNQALLGAEWAVRHAIGSGAAGIRSGEARRAERQLDNEGTKPG
jgi:hypothetical protein